MQGSVRKVELRVQCMVAIYPVTRGQATKMVVFGSGASQAAALHWRRYGGDRQKMIDDVTPFISGGLETFVA